MNPRVARWSGAALAVALVLSLGLLLLLSSGKLLVSQRGTLGGSAVSTEFESAWPLQPGMSVRVDGVVAGTVEDVQLTRHGTADVQLRLSADAPEPRADASAAIRQGDVLGDTYVDLQVGRAAEPLGNTRIGTTRTAALPRLDAALSTFREPVRDGLRVILTELATSLEQRGTDVNETVLRLRPALVALDDLFSELEGQETNLRSVINDSDRLIAQLSVSNRSIDRGLVSLDRVLATTADHSKQLDRTLTRAPGAMTALQRSLRDVETVSVKARPLARSLASAAPELRAAAPLVRRFASAAGRSADDLSPALELLHRTLVAGGPTLKQLAGVSPADLLLPASGLLETISPLFGVGAAAFFGASSYGEKTSGEGGLGAILVEPGNHPTSPDIDPRRGIGRIAVALSCESFGQPIRPGCLGKLLNAGAPFDPSLIPTERKVSPRRAPAAPKGSSAKDPTLELLDYLLR